ncbi:MAG: hypothetical protein M1575_03055 [Patescibacteria group bacterium]|nr:hypothetical protein [Patescibacteria group bacterium]MCL5095681.1 hypothetical protein [Patescibacteria group bacterium]
MVKKVGCFLKTSSLQVFLGVILVIMTTIGVFLFWNSTKKAEQILSERAKTRELILARAGALAISDFFESRKTKLLLLANIEEIKSLDPVKGRAITQTFVQEMIDRPITSLGVIDKNGKIVWSENPQKQKVGEGTDLSDREYFLWAKSQTQGGKVYVSVPVIARTGPAKGTWIILITTPLFYKNQFNGVLYAVVTTKDLVEKYVKPLTISPYSVQTLLNKGGEIVASSIAGNPGINLLNSNPNLATNLTKEEEGSVITELNYPDDQSYKALIGYAPVKIDQQLWFLLISVPYKEVKDQLNPFSEIQDQGLALLLIGLIVVVLFHVLAARIRERQGYINGYCDGVEELKKRERKTK